MAAVSLRPVVSGTAASVSIAGADDSPGAWQRAEGIPRKGGRRWAPKAMCGAVVGDSSGGGWDISLRGERKKERGRKGERERDKS